MNCYIVGSVGALLIVVLPHEAIGYPATIRWAWVRLTTMDAIHFCAPPWVYHKLGAARRLQLLGACQG